MSLSPTPFLLLISDMMKILLRNHEAALYAYSLVLWYLETVPSLNIGGSGYTSHIENREECSSLFE